MTNTERPATDPIPAPVDSGAIGRLNEAENDDDGPECETCGKTTCPDADLPGFSEPRNCKLTPIYEAIRDAKDCDYGCARDLTNQEIRLFVAPAVDRIVREHTDRALAEAWDAALRHVWALNDPAYTVITDTESIHPILTRRDVEQAANENPYRAAQQEQGR